MTKTVELTKTFAIVPNPNVISGKNGYITPITVKEISEILGFRPNVADDPDKVVNSWGFTIAGQDFAIWDYKGSHYQKYFSAFSAFGSSDILTALFGDRYSPCKH